MKTMINPTNSFQRGKLEAGLSRLSIVTRRSTFPAAYLFNGSTISVGNGESQATFDYGEGVGMEEAVVPASAIAMFLRGAKDGLITLHREGPGKLSIQSDDAQFETSLLEPSAVCITDIRVDNWMGLDGESIGLAMREAGIWCGSHNHYREFNHVQVSNGIGGLIVLSTNRSFMAVTYIPCKSTMDTDAFVPKAMLDLIAGASGEVELAFSDKRASFRGDGLVAHHALYAENRAVTMPFINKAKLVPVAAVVDRSRLLSALVMAGASSPDKILVGVDFTISNDSVKISRKSSESKFDATIQAHTHTEASFRAAHDNLSKALDSMECADVELRTTSDPADPIVIVPKGKEWPMHIASKSRMA